MHRINAWLIRRLDKLPDPEPLPPKLDRLRLTIERRVSAAVCVTILAVGGVSILSQMLLPLWWGIFVFVPMVFVSLISVSVAMSYHSRAAVRDYTVWLREQPRTRRVTRVGVPYDRQPPTATLACLDCPAQPGQRHARSCPSVPPEWFNRGQ